MLSELLPWHSHPPLLPSPSRVLQSSIVRSARRFPDTLQRSSPGFAPARSADVAMEIGQAWVGPQPQLKQQRPAEHAARPVCRKQWMDESRSPRHRLKLKPARFEGCLRRSSVAVARSYLVLAFPISSLGPLP